MTEAFIAHALDDVSRRASAVHQFLESSRAPCDELDLMLGRASTLAGCASLLRIDRANADLAAYGAAVDHDIWNKIRLAPPVMDCADVQYLGIAHGWAGLIYASLLWHETAGTEPCNELKERLVQLEKCGEPLGQGMAWPLRPPSFASADVGFMAGWCHGSAGYVHLWTTAARVLAMPHSVDLAIAAATHSWRAGSVAGHLCCGAAGQAYAMLALYRHTRDHEWLLRAHELARVAARYDVEPGRFTSLYRGALGVSVLIADLETPDEAAMPFFEPERW
jgi:serine/threonine-protein kinase